MAAIYTQSAKCKCKRKTPRCSPGESQDVFAACPGNGSASISRKPNDIAMNGYLFTAGLTRCQVRPTAGRGGQMFDSIQTWDACMSAIIYGGDTEQAQKRFEAWCRQTP